MQNKTRTVFVACKTCRNPWINEAIPTCMPSKCVLIFVVCIFRHAFVGVLDMFYFSFRLSQGYQILPFNAWLGFSSMSRIVLFLKFPERKITVRIECKSNPVLLWCPLNFHSFYVLYLLPFETLSFPGWSALASARREWVPHVLCLDFIFIKRQGDNTYLAIKNYVIVDQVLSLIAIYFWAALYINKCISLPSGNAIVIACQVWRFLKSTCTLFVRMYLHMPKWRCLGMMLGTVGYKSSAHDQWKIQSRTFSLVFHILQNMSPRNLEY